MTRETGCQTESVSSRYAGVQANVKPIRRSKATQARIPNRSVSCDTVTLMEPFTECPGATSTPIKRKRFEVSTDDSSYHQDGSESIMNCASSWMPSKSRGSLSSASTSIRPSSLSPP